MFFGGSSGWHLPLLIETLAQYQMHNSPVTLELCDEEVMFPAVRLDHIDVFTTRKIQWKMLNTKASLYQGVDLKCREFASNFRWYFRTTSCGHSGSASSSELEPRKAAY